MNIPNESIAMIIKALSHPTRIQILDILRKHDELCVCHLYEELELEQSNVSQHLKLLRDQGILSTRKVSQKVMYKIEYKEALSIIDSSRSIATKNVEKIISLHK